MAAISLSERSMPMRGPIAKTRLCNYEIQITGGALW
jgi:hypothetical protein